MLKICHQEGQVINFLVLVRIYFYWEDARQHLKCKIKNVWMICMSTIWFKMNLHNYKISKNQEKDFQLWPTEWDFTYMEAKMELIILTIFNYWISLMCVQITVIKKDYVWILFANVFKIGQVHRIYIRIWLLTEFKMQIWMFFGRNLQSGCWLWVLFRLWRRILQLNYKLSLQLYRKWIL